MLSLIIARVAKSKVFRYVLATCAFLVFLFGIYTYGFWQGEASKDAEYKIVIDAERVRLSEEKAKAMRDAQSRIAELQNIIATRNRQLKEIISEATKDPNAGSFSIGPDSVRRLNRTR